MKIYYKEIDHEVIKRKSHMGLPVYMIKKQNSRGVKMGLLVNFGGDDLTYADLNNKSYRRLKPGTAHFLEHQLFSSDDSLLGRFSKLGSEVNAYTDNTKTVYYMSCIDNINDNIKLFLNMMQNPHITDKSVNKERDVIIQEIKMYNDNPSWRVYSNFLKGLYVRNYHRNEIAGSIEDVEAISTEEIRESYENFYTPENSALFIVGDIDEDRIMDIVEKSWRKRHHNKKIMKIFPHEPCSVNKAEVSEALDISTSRFAMGFKALSTEAQNEFTVKNEMILSIIMECILGPTSELYIKLYRDNLINNSFSFGVSANKHFVHSAVGGESQEPFKVRDKIIEEILGIKRDGIDYKDVQIIKSMIYGNTIRAFDNDMTLLNNLINYKNKGIDYFQILKIIDSVDEEDILKGIVEYFDPKLFTMSVAVPK